MRRLLRSGILDKIGPTERMRYMQPARARWHRIRVRNSVQNMMSFGLQMMDFDGDWLLEKMKKVMWRVGATIQVRPKHSANRRIFVSY